MSQISFSKQDVTLFSKASFDVNPLHMDSVYAYRTPFGRPVVFGMAGVVKAISIWANNKKFRIKKINGEFKKPLFIDEIYTLEFKEKDDTVEFRILKDQEVHTKFRLISAPFKKDPLFKTNFKPVREAFSGEQKAEATYEESYAPDEAAFGEYLGSLDLNEAECSFQQIAMLLWSSYFVGMRAPGKQALFSNFSFNFGEEKSLFPLIVKTSFRARSNFLTIKAEKGDFKAVLNAFVRPRPVAYSISDIKQEIKLTQELNGKRVLVTGASRGFGSVLAKAFGTKGAHLLLHYRSAASEAKVVKNELLTLGASGELLQFDLNQNAEAKVSGPVDVLVCNASPMIEHRAVEMPPEELSQYIAKSLSFVERPFRSFLGHLSHGAKVVFVSSIYVKKPAPGFAHYVAAKKAIEGLAQALSKEYPNYHFIVARPPKIKTEQTNVPFDPIPAVSAVPSARKLVEHLSTLPFDKNFHEFDV